MTFKQFGLMALAIGSLGAASGAVPAFAQPSAGIPACTSLPSGADSYTCSCPAGTPTGSVWGSNPYTADSNICAAALHAGVVGTAGGTVSLLITEGQDSYTGSEVNGISSSDWGAFATSIAFTKAPVAVGGAPICEGVPDGATAFECGCDPANGFAGSIWGSGPYTADSDICTAARHFGAIDELGGTVRVLVVQGLEQYTSLDWQGITSSDWGSYPSSITFDLNVPR